jgi:hypothetical protein
MISIAPCTRTCTLRFRAEQGPSKLLSHNNGVWRSPVARLLWEQEVPGSNPGAPIETPGPADSLWPTTRL